MALVGIYSVFVTVHAATDVMADRGDGGQTKDSGGQDAARGSQIRLAGECLEKLDPCSNGCPIKGHGGAP
jgi:hypothetical protein